MEHRLEIAGGPTDDLEYVGGRGLLLKGFSQVACTVLHLVEQTDILDCDYGLVGKSRHKLDLFLGEWPYISTQQYERADRLAFTEKGHAKDGAGVAAEPLRIGPKRVVRVGMHVGYMDHSSFEARSAHQWFRARGASQGRSFMCSMNSAEKPYEPARKILIALLARNKGHVRLAKAGGRFHKRVEHRLQIERRAADDF